MWNSTTALFKKKFRILITVVAISMSLMCSALCKNVLVMLTCANV